MMGSTNVMNVDSYATIFFRNFVIATMENLLINRKGGPLHTRPSKGYRLYRPTESPLYLKIKCKGVSDNPLQLIRNDLLIH